MTGAETSLLVAARISHTMAQARPRVISGGQTGVDRLALEEARAAGLPTGGFAPRGFMTEDGPDPSLAGFGLVPHASRSYPARTAANVDVAEVTAVFTRTPGVPPGGGTGLTISVCRKRRKPCLIDPSPQALALAAQKAQTINVAGPRGSRLPPGRLAQIKQALAAAFALLAK